MAQQSRGVGRTGADRSNDVDPADVIAAFDDPACRRILAATDGEARTAQELSEECDVPLSTLYRKIDLLVDTTLLEERIRLNSKGRHSKEYVRSVTQVELSMSEGRLDVELGRDADERHARRN